MGRTCETFGSEGFDSFILGSTRKYRSEKHQTYLPDGKILKDPYIAFYSSKKNSNGAACLISWEYEKKIMGDFYD